MGTAVKSCPFSLENINFAKGQIDMNKYSNEELMKMSVGRLIEIVESLQTNVDELEFLRRKLARIAAIAVSEMPKEKTKRGRKPFTPEQRAQSYEEYKRRKREKYAADKVKKNEENNEQ